MGGGAVLELSHEIDYLLEFFHVLEVLSSNSSRLSSLNIDVEDSAEVVLIGKNGPHQKVLVSLSLDFISHKTERYCQIVCDNATIEWDILQGTINFYENKTPCRLLSKEEDPVSETYIKQMHDFLKDDSPNQNLAEFRRCVDIANIVQSIRRKSP